VASSVNEAFELYLGEGCEAYVALERLEAAEAIDLAHASNAVVSVAHPMRLHDSSTLDELHQLGADGVEVIHPSADAGARRELAEYATRHGLLVTGGSDFHGPSPDYGLGIELGWGHVEALKERTAAGRARLSAT
jgi:3',5'-nucleoside bisphosphate phosphatase